MAGEIDADGKRKDGLDAFLEQKVAEGFTVETQTNTHAIIFRRPKGLRRFTSGHDPGRFVVEVDEDGVASMRDAEPRRFLSPDAAWERRLDQLWSSLDEQAENAFRAAIDALMAELPEGSAVALFERACAFDATGHSDCAVPLYREALDHGLDGIRRRRATIQLASSLRNLGQSAESVALLEAERARENDELDDAVAAFLALALVDVGREREAASLAVAALAPHVPRYQRSLANYAAALVKA